MKNRLIIITSFIVLLFGQTVLKALDDTIWCKYTYPTSIYAVKFTPDGKYLATGGSDGVVTIWNALTGDSIKSYSYSGRITSLDISPDGTLIAISSTKDFSEPVKVYNLQSDTLVATLLGIAVKFSTDGNYLVTGGYIYETKTWQKVGTFPTYGSYPNGESIVSIDISADNKYIATGTYLYKDAASISCKIRLYQFSNFQEVNEYILLDGACSFPNVRFSPDGKYLAGSAIDDTVRIWTLPDRTIYKKFCHYSEVDAIAFSPDGNYLIEGGGVFGNYPANIWEISTNNLKYSYPITKIFGYGGVNSISINKDQSLIGIGGGFGIYMLNAKWNPVSVSDDIITITNNTIYPNPTSSVANIEFTLTKQVQANISIYDNNSNLIATLYNGLLESGLQNFQWNTNEMVSGIYYCNINVNNQLSTIKIIVNK